MGKSIFPVGGLHLKMLSKTKQYTLAMKMQQGPSQNKLYFQASHNTFFLSFFETRFYYISLGVLELAMSGLDLKNPPASAETKDICYHTWLHTNVLWIFLSSLSMGTDSVI